MRQFQDIWDIAANRKGGDAALEALLSYPKSKSELEAIPDDRWLSKASQMIFNAGFNWKVVEKKMPAMETAFDGFNLDKIAYWSDEDFDRLIADKSIIRHATKIKSVHENAIFFRELRDEYGSVGQYFAASQPENYIALLDVLKKRGSRLGGNTGAYFLRSQGVDSFIFSQDVTARLMAENVVDKTPTSKTAMRQAQAAFNEWRAQSGRSLTEISRVLAMSV